MTGCVKGRRPELQCGVDKVVLLGRQGKCEERRENSEDVGVEGTRVATLEAVYDGLPGLDDPLSEVEWSLVEGPRAGSNWPLVTGHGNRTMDTVSYCGTCLLGTEDSVLISEVS